MSTIEVGRLITLAILVLVCTGLLALLVLLAVHFMMPKHVLTRYWKPPHFGPFRIAAFTGTVWAPVRTAMLIAAIAFPSVARRRHMVGIRNVIPQWLRLTAYALASVWLLVTQGLIVLTGILLVHLHLRGEIHLWPGEEGSTVDWDLLIAIAIFLICAVLLGLRGPVSRLRARKPGGAKPRSATHGSGASAGDP
jgi:hypothetical protein